MENRPLMAMIFISLIGHSLIAQNKNTKIVQGQTINLNLESIPFIKIKIAGKSEISLSDSTGTFHIQVLETDTLIFSALEYSELKIPVYQLNHDFNYVTMQPKIYDLNTVDIFETRWQDFKYDFMNKEIKQGEQKVVVIKGLPDPYTIQMPAKPSPLGNPLTFLYEFFKKENIRKRKMERWGNIYQRSQIQIKKLN